MSLVPRSNQKFALTALAIIAFSLLANACAPHPKAIPTWGGVVPPTSGTSDTVHTSLASVTSMSDNAGTTTAFGRTTFTQGCTGSFSIRDARTNRQISSGRAFNSGVGLIALDNRGRQTRAVSSAPNLSVTFLPDCNCRLGGNQLSGLPTTQQFSASAPSARHCAPS